ncbi:hypothetical protein ACFPIJ_55885 [Dactylosporangium cerinum]|uniref:Uncharacterized protein n=1 Tax=Dactylosporangium cerinum TaxID=1434730 RepID=A0ABV9WEB7_9ACTN
MDTIDWATAACIAEDLPEHDGDDAYIVALLAGPLSGVDPATVCPDPLLIRATLLYARAVDPAPDPAPVATSGASGPVVDDVAWARYAYQAARTLHSIDHSTAIETTETLALVLTSRNQHSKARALRRDVIQLHLDRGDVDAHPEARITLAAHLHDTGRCGEAIRGATAAWRQWSTRHDPTDPVSEPLTFQVASMLLACGRTDDAAEVIDAADLNLGEAASAGGSATASGARSEFLAMLAASQILHQAVCARRLDHTLTTAAAGDDRGAQ